MTSYLRVVFLAMLGMALAPELFAEPTGISVTPMDRLLEKPESFNGQRVRTVGYALFPARNQSYLFVSNETGDRMILTSAICIEYPAAAWEKIKDYRPGWVEISGLFHATPPGVVSTAGTSCTISIDDQFAIAPVLSYHETEREKLVINIARLSAILDAAKAPKAHPSEEELELQLKRSVLRLRRYDLTGKVPMDGE